MNLWYVAGGAAAAFLLGRWFLAWGIRIGTRLERHRCLEMTSRTLARMDLGAVPKRQREALTRLVGWLGTGSTLSAFEAHEPSGPGRSAPLL